jgi:periplasmic protein CpxP/Spy
MIRFRFLTAGILIAGLLAGGAAFAQGPAGPGAPGGGFGGRGGRGGPGAPGGPGELGLPLQQLNLSDAQRQQIRDLVQRRLEESRDNQERVRAAQEVQRKAMDALPVNEGAIRAAAQDLAAAQADAAVQQAHVRAEVFALLTADQQAQVKKLVAEREARAGERRDRPDTRRERRQNQ